MNMNFELKRHVSKFILVLRVVDAALVPTLLYLIMVLTRQHVGERAWLFSVVAMLLTALSMESVGLYRRWRGTLIRREIHTILAGWALVTAGIYLMSLAIDGATALPTRMFIAWLVLCPMAISCAHLVGRSFLRLARKQGYNQRSAVVAGAGLVGTALVRKLQSTPWAGIDVRGYFDDDIAKHGQPVESVPVLGSLNDLGTFVCEQGIDMVYLALPMRAEEQMLSIMGALSGSNAGVYMVPDIFVFDLLGAKILDIDGIPVVSLSESPQIGPSGALKRLEDLVIATVGLVLLAPVFAVLALAVRRSGAGPIFFGHQRVGRGGRLFKCYKFRTMMVDADRVLHDMLAKDPVARAEWEENFKLKDDPRITRVGKFLRRTSLDELPQLWNVLKGEMSLVGPRPIVEGEVEKYGKYYRHLALVRPGLTGLWQVSGRSNLTYEERVDLDVEYARTWSVTRDLSILARTFRVVLARQGSC